MNRAPAGGRGLGLFLMPRTLPDGSSLGSQANPFTYDGAGRVVTVPGSKPARLRPQHAQAANADSSSWDYSFQGYDASGAPIDLATQSDQLASLGMDWRWYFRTASDSMTIEDDFRSHSRVDGFLASATRYVANATDTARVATDQIASNYHVVGFYDGHSTMTNLAWEKSGTPTYPVAGSIALHWHWVYDQTYNGQHYAGDWLVDGTITFNGTRYATAVIGNYTFTIDLVTGAVS